MAILFFNNDYGKVVKVPDTTLVFIFFSVASEEKKVTLWKDSR